VSASHAAGPAPDRLRSPLTALAPEVKVVGLVAFLVAVAVTPPTAPWALAAQGAVAVAVAGLALVDWRAVAGRLALDLPLAVLAVAYAVAGRGPHVEVLGLALSEPGLRVGLGILAKATIGIVAVSALAASTSVPDTIAGLARVGAPAWFRQLLALSARQLQVLRADLSRIRRAVEVRTASTRRSVALAAGARSLGSLFIRSTERADNLRLAAELRGGDAATGIALPSPATRSTPSAPGHGPADGRRTVPAWAWGLFPAVLAVATSVVLR
jgi:cobalt/nickel transport system permease protein